MECFVITLNGWKPLTMHFILDVAAALDPPLLAISKQCLWYECFILLTKSFSSKLCCISLKLQRQLQHLGNAKPTPSLNPPHKCWPNVSPVHKNTLPKISNLLLPFISIWYPSYNFLRSSIIGSSVILMSYGFTRLALTKASNLIAQIFERNSALGCPSNNTCQLYELKCISGLRTSNSSW